ncbi:MAG: molecular chaperone TorD family protein [Alphaproteobacteria bacterium]|nr:molecular chaperone TorD family protein [Alphaproteobacteria bacterium]
MTDALGRAIAALGGQTQLARRLGVKQANVWHWLNRAGRVPGEYVLAIEQATDGRVTRHELRPDLYPDAGNRAAPASLPEEEVWRARLYALLGRALARRPDAPLLAALSRLEGDETPLGRALGELAARARACTPAQAEDEYFALFVGLPRGELLPYASYYRTGFLYERPLARLRGDMAALGLARAEEVAEPEDHMGAICEMMSLLISGGDGRGPAELATQERMFRKHLEPWAERFFEDLERAESAHLYRPLGSVGRHFMAIERQGFALAA